MKISNDPEVDALSITFRETTVTTKHLAEGIAADYDRRPARRFRNFGRAKTLWRHRNHAPGRIGRRWHINLRLTCSTSSGEVAPRVQSDSEDETRKSTN